MAAKTNPRPVTQATPYLCVRDASKAIDFYRRVFDAVEVMRLEEPGGKIGHAEIRIGDSPIFVSDEYPDFLSVGPETVGGSSMIIQLYVPDVDEVFQKAVAAGSKVIFPVNDQFYGDRSGRIQDPFGHLWIIATHKENVSEGEMKKRFAQYAKQQTK